MASLNEHTELPLIIIKYLIICKNNKDYRRIRYVYFFYQIYLIDFLIMFFKLYFIYLIF